MCKFCQNQSDHMQIYLYQSPFIKLQEFNFKQYYYKYLNYFHILEKYNQIKIHSFRYNGLCHLLYSCINELLFLDSKMIHNLFLLIRFLFKIMVFYEHILILLSLERKYALNFTKYSFFLIKSYFQTLYQHFVYPLLGFKQFITFS